MTAPAGDPLRQLELCPEPTSFSEEDRLQLRRVAAALRFLRRRETVLGERRVSFRVFARSIERLVTSYARTESPLEREFYALLVEEGLAWHFEPQVTIPVTVVQQDGSRRPTLCRPDFVARGPRLAVFVDGIAFHSSADAIERDAAITFALNLARWQVLRVHPRPLRESPSAVLEQVRQALSFPSAA